MRDGFPLVERVPVRGQWMESVLRPFPRDRSWCRGRFTVSVAYANAEKVFPAFGHATFVVGATWIAIRHLSTDPQF